MTIIVQDLSAENIHRTVFFSGVNKEDMLEFYNKAREIGVKWIHESNYSIFEEMINGGNLFALFVDRHEAGGLSRLGFSYLTDHHNNMSYQQRYDEFMEYREDYRVIEAKKSIRFVVKEEIITFEGNTYLKRDVIEALKGKEI
ncbi:hypothetical protein [Ralstonia phage RSP15]|uniref:hypothetical protein n=1 Tax=Ralstonia phage RSP15 TaxID=1785960 RepID=UPI00074D2DFD|nr:hypothetical protein BH754_gp165 [Ralstonia phage RSP15]BAU40141.1 hypothetical protein [Ralstonia phage RSP15]